MKSIKINIPEGFELDSYEKDSTEIKFKPIVKPVKVTDRIKTINDVLKDNGITETSYHAICEYAKSDEIGYFLLKLICKSLNEGWTPDWSNANEYKYFPWFEMRSGFRFHGYNTWSATSTSAVGSRLCFKTRELAEYAGKQFESVYKQFMVI